jgi:predicted amidohydrolase
MRDLRVTLVQSMLHWEDAEANRRMLATKLAGLEGRTDLIVLPEMFTTGFTMRSADLAEAMNGPSVRWMKEQAAKLGAALYGSVIIAEDGKRYNRGLFVTPAGTVEHYDKRHLFRMAEEKDHYARGARRVVVQLHGWRLLLQICYDLRFPVFSRTRGDYDAAIYCACWPEPRRFPWSQLLIARAIENQCYVLGVNRVGMDGKGHHYMGDSVALDPRGACMAGAAPGEEALVNAELSYDALADFRTKFPVGADADGFELMP